MRFALVRGVSRAHTRHLTRTCALHARSIFWSNQTLRSRSCIHSTHTHTAEFIVDVLFYVYIVIWADGSVSYAVCHNFIQSDSGHRNAMFNVLHVYCMFYW